MSATKVSRIPWTQMDKTYVRRRYKADGPVSVAQALGRSKRSVDGMAYKLGLMDRRQAGARVEFEIECFVCKSPFRPLVSAWLRGGGGSCYCINCIRQYRRARTSAARECRGWTSEEDERVMNGERDLPGRSYDACRTRARVLGAVEPKPAWSKEDLQALRRWADTKTAPQIAKELGRTPRSVWAMVQKLKIPLRARQLRPRKLKMTDRQRRIAPETIEKAVSRHIPAQIRREVVQELTLAVLERRIPFKDIAAHVKPTITRVYAMYPNFGAPLSLDAKVFDDGHMTLGDTIDSTAFRF